MKIFITGSGLIGGFSAKRLIDLGHEVILFDKRPSRRYIKRVFSSVLPTIEGGDIRDVNLLTKLLKKHKPNCIVHTAAVLRNVFEKQPILGVSINTVGVASIILAAANAGVKRIILCSSLSVYDYSSQVKPVAENQPLKPNGLYDATKLSGEYIAISLAHRHNIDLIILRFASVYGYGIFKGGAWLGKQLQEIFIRLLTNKNVVLEEKEFGSNEYVYVKDVSQAIEKSCLKSIQGINVFNIGSGKILSAAQLADTFVRVSCNNKIEFKAMSNPMSIPDFMKRKYPFDLKKAKDILGYTPAFTFIKGMQDYKNYLVPIVGKTA
jgi:nucleoside-diphosphate-sugar epimerase